MIAACTCYEFVTNCSSKFGGMVVIWYEYRQAKRYDCTAKVPHFHLLQILTSSNFAIARDVLKCYLFTNKYSCVKVRSRAR